MNIRLTVTAIMAALFLCAVCAPAFSADQVSPGAENWGKAYEAAKKAQIEHPDAGKCPHPVNGLDGIAAQIAVEGYRAGFITKKEETTNVKWGIGNMEKTTVSNQ